MHCVHLQKSAYRLTKNNIPGSDIAVTEISAITLMQVRLDSSFLLYSECWILWTATTDISQEFRHLQAQAYRNPQDENGDFCTENPFCLPLGDIRSGCLSDSQLMVSPTVPLNLPQNKSCPKTFIFQLWKMQSDLQSKCSQTQGTT